MFSRMLIPPLCCILATAFATSLFVSAAPHPSLPGATVPDGLGVNIHFTDPMVGEMELLAAAGFRWVRMDLGWANIERELGVYDFSAFDRLTGHLQKHGMKALLILDYSNQLYEKDRSVQTAAGREAFARWAAAAAKRYQGRGYLWEVWNEPNISFWKPKPDAAAYSALARAAAAAIREAAPGEAVIGPATSGFDFPFIDACFKNGVLNDWDAVSVHPYRQNEPESVLPDYGKLRQAIRRAAPTGREIPVISGEWGYSAAWANYDEDLQGRMLPRQFLTNLSQNIPLSIWYDWRDDGPEPHEPEHHFGTVGLPQTVDGNIVFRIKPAYRAARALTTTLQGHRFIRRLALGASDDWVLLFSNDRESVVACWTTAGETRTIRLPSGEGCRTRNHLGDDGPFLAANDGWIETPLDATPRYLRFDRLIPPLMKLPAAPAFTCYLVPAPGGVYLALVDNPAGDPFSGSLHLTGHGETKAVPLTLAAGETTAQVRFDILGGGGSVSETGLEVWQGERRIMILPARRSLLGDPDLLGRCAATSDGDPQVKSIQTITVAKEAPPLPGGFTVPVAEITCRFEEGWRFVTLQPNGPRSIPGRPKSFGVWVFGDASGAGLRLRVQDANGRTWQPDGGEITWRGWRHVRFDLTPGTAHWGGEGEDVIQYPLQWDAPILLDNISRKPLETRVFVTAPTMNE